MSVAPGSQVAAHLTLLGQDAPHTDWKLELDFFPADGNSYPDAWRLDSLGCARETEMVYFSPPPVETCLHYFFSTSPHAILQPRRIYEFIPGENRMRLSLSMGMDLLHDPAPEWVYLLATVYFYHSSSVKGPGDGETECGGLERPFCIRLVEAKYRAGDGTWVDWPIGPDLISANAGGITSCLALPAHPATWGAIKAQYR